MSKTPYELRYDLLAMAQSILSEQNMNERIRIENDWNMECDKLRKFENPNYPKFPKVTQYDAEQVIALAKQLNDFVSKND